MRTQEKFVGGLIALAAMTLLVCPPAEAAVQLLGNSFGTGILYDINTTTGAATNPRNTGIVGLDGIAFRTANDTLYGLNNSGTLYTINTSTGLATVVGSTGFSFIEADLAYDSSADAFYGIQEFSGIRRLVRINPSTGAGTLVGTMTPDVGDYSAGAFDLTGTLWVLNTGLPGNSTLSTVNKLTGAILTTIAMNVDLGATAGLTFHPETGEAYVVDGNTGGTNRLYTLNTTTGVLTNIGLLGAGDMAGLAFIGSANAVPEPASLAMFGIMGSIGGCLIGYRRRKFPA